jgi:cellulose synthase/poly-beta-1,6-N-acetylglucosamine synthase-like glycosyltransferase
MLITPVSSVLINSTLQTTLIVCFVAVTLAMIPYGYSCFFMIWKSHNYVATNLTNQNGSDNPFVTIQLPIYNERYVVNRLLAAVAHQDYPKDKLEIQVLDDSTDDTAFLAEKSVFDLRAHGYDVSWLHRDNRAGFKGGALDNGLRTAKGQFIAIFDADFVPKPDFLKNALVPLMNDSNVGWVQTRWDHINRSYSWLTDALAFGIDGHFFVEQTCRSAENLTSNFCGTCGILRRKAIEDVGGWSKHILTEDLYLSYLMQLKGWKGHYLRDVSVPGEIPATVTGLKYQQGRWCKGTVQVSKRVLPTIWRTKSFSFKKKILATLHLTYYTVHPLLFLLLLTSAPLVISGIVLRHYGVWWQILTVLDSICAFATPLMYLEGARLRGLSVSKRLKSLILLTVGGYGISISNTMNYLDALFGQVGEFKRTPKYSISTRNDSWQDKRYQPSIPPSAPIEIAAGAYSLVALGFALIHFDLTAALFLVFYASGYLVVGSSTLREALVRRKLAQKAD